jgi:hypothetical protein
MIKLHKTTDVAVDQFTLEDQCVQLETANVTIDSIDVNPPRFGETLHFWHISPLISQLFILRDSPFTIDSVLNSNTPNVAMAMRLVCIFMHIRPQQCHRRLLSHRLTGQNPTDVDIVALPEIFEDRDTVHLRGIENPYGESSIFLSKK